MPYRYCLDPKRTHSRQCARQREYMTTGDGLAIENGSIVQIDLDSSKKAVRCRTRRRW